MIEEAKSTILNCINKCKEQYKLFQNRRELRRVEKNFFQNNNISNENSEKYIKYFRRNLGNFIASNSDLQNEPNVKDFLLRRLENDFVYYSRQAVESFLKQKFQDLITKLDEEGLSINDCYISSILNKDTNTNNSSRELMFIFRDINGLDRNKTLTLEKYIDHEVQYEIGIEELDKNIQENPCQIYYPKRKAKLEQVYKSKKFSLIKDLDKQLESKSYLIFIDDFSGSGKTIKRFFKRLKDYIPKRIQIIIICIHMMEKAENELNNFFKSSVYKDRVEIYFNDSKPSSRKKYFPTRKDPLRKEIRLFEEKLFEEQFALGFEATEALVSTYENCPNNTFACFWYPDNSSWAPLFNRPRKRSSKLDEINLDRNEWLKTIKFGLKRKGVPSENFQQVIALIFVKINPTMTTTKINVDFKYNFQYNESVLQECVAERFITIKYDFQGVSKYSLTPGGKELLKSYHLLSTNFEKLTEVKETEASDKLDINGNDYEKFLPNYKSAE